MPACRRRARQHRWVRLATPYICSARSYTVGDGPRRMGLHGQRQHAAGHQPGHCPAEAAGLRHVSQRLNLTTIPAAIPKAQFAIPEVNLEAGNPGVFTDLQRMVDLLIRRDRADHHHLHLPDGREFQPARRPIQHGSNQYAQSKKLPLIDLNKELLARLPFSQWPGRSCRMACTTRTHDPVSGNQ